MQRDINVHIVASIYICFVYVWITADVPVQMCVTAGRSFTDSHPLTGQNVINVHKWVVGGHGEVFSSIFKKKENLSYFSKIQIHTPTHTYIYIYIYINYAMYIILLLYIFIYTHTHIYIIL